MHAPESSISYINLFSKNLILKCVTGKRLCLLNYLLVYPCCQQNLGPCLLPITPLTLCVTWGQGTNFTINIKTIIDWKLCRIPYHASHRHHPSTDSLILPTNLVIQFLPLLYNKTFWPHSAILHMKCPYHLQVSPEKSSQKNPQTQYYLYTCIESTSIHVQN